MTRSRTPDPANLPLEGMIPLALIVAVSMLFLLPRELQLQTRALAAWNGAVITFLVTICLRHRSVVPGTAPPVGAYGKTGALAAVLIVCLASVAATAMTLRTIARHERGATTHANLSVLAVLSSWVLLQTMFALFYARNYYVPGNGSDAEPRTGLQFPTHDVPDFWDFIYFSFTVGFSYAVSDTNIRSRVLRRAVLLQATVSFLFYTVIIGLVMNVILQIV